MPDKRFPDKGGCRPNKTHRINQKPFRVDQQPDRIMYQDKRYDDEYKKKHNQNQTNAANILIDCLHHIFPVLYFANGRLSSNPLFNQWQRIGMGVFGF